MKFYDSPSRNNRRILIAEVESLCRAGLHYDYYSLTLIFCRSRKTFSLTAPAVGAFVYARCESPTPSRGSKNACECETRKDKRKAPLNSNGGYAAKGNCRLPFILISSTLESTFMPVADSRPTRYLSSNENQFLSIYSCVQFTRIK